MYHKMLPYVVQQHADAADEALAPWIPQRDVRDHILSFVQFELPPDEAMKQDLVRVFAGQKRIFHYFLHLFEQSTQGGNQQPRENKRQKV